MKIIVTALVATVAATAAHSAPVQWTSGPGANNHWYDFVILDAALTATEAEAAAEASVFGGASGYLATITSAEEQAFLNANWTGAGSVAGQFNNLSYFLIGASDRDVEGDFKWIGGPEDGDAIGYSNWSGGEPNNLGGEDYAVGWWNDSLAGLWNDVGGGSFKAYLVEYNDAVSPVPIPASLPLMLAAFGGLYGLRRTVARRD